MEVRELKFNIIKKGNFNKMRLEFSQMDWTKINNLSVEQCWEEIKGKIHASMESNIPKNKTTNHKRNKPMWLDTMTMKFIKKKYRPN